VSLDAHPALRRARGGAFYLHGEDQFRKEEVLRALVDAHVDPGTRDFNLDLLRGSEVDPERLASVMATPPMMGEWRVVVLREVEGLAGAKRAALVPLKEVQPLTGYIRGGVTALAAKRRFEVLLDESALEHTEIAVSAGQRGLQLVLDPRDYAQAVAAKLGALCAASTDPLA